MDSNLGRFKYLLSNVDRTRWSPRSSELTTFDYWPWSYLKENTGNTAEQQKRDIIRSSVRSFPICSRGQADIRMDAHSIVNKNDGAYTITMTPVGPGNFFVYIYIP